MEGLELKPILQVLGLLEPILQVLELLVTKPVVVVAAVLVVVPGVVVVQKLPLLHWQQLMY